jgi:RecG-like helicase
VCDEWQVDSVLLVVMQSSQLTSQRLTFEKLIGSDVRLVQEQTSLHQVIAMSLHEMKVRHRPFCEYLPFKLTAFLKLNKVMSQYTVM